MDKAEFEALSAKVGATLVDAPPRPAISVLLMCCAAIAAKCEINAPAAALMRAVADLVERDEAVFFDLPQ